jgi:hypothetical protein
MRPPFYIDKLEPTERTTVRRWQMYVGGFYSALAVLVVAFMVVKTDRLQLQMAKFAATNQAVAAERGGSPLCAARDLRLVTQIEQLGEAQTVPGEQLADAFFTMTKARDLCRAGRIKDALAVYDGIAVAPVQSAANK